VRVRAASPFGQVMTSASERCASEAVRACEGGVDASAVVAAAVAQAKALRLPTAAVN